MNKFYKKHWSKFCIVKVRYGSTTGAYDYTCLRSLKPKVGDLVCVVTGSNELSNENAQVAKITAISSKVEHLTEEFQLRSVVCIINTEKYDKINKAMKK